MFDAEVGDDVLGDDPTVAKLEAKVAELLGKGAGLFVPSGTMANQLAVRTHTEPGDEIIIETMSHVFLHETGALAALSGVGAQLVPGDRGLLSAEQVERAVRGDNYHFPPTRLVVLENTHNHGGGTPYSLKGVEAIHRVAQSRNLKIHMDGARLWNACIAKSLKPAQYAQYCDSVSVCLSKGLGAPVGSVLVGGREFIRRARRFRKMFGGGMRQSGILAAAGIFALDHNYERLREDHDNAKHMAESLGRHLNLLIHPEEVETNMLYFGIRGRSPDWVAAELEKRGVRVFAERPAEVRAVTHLDVTRAQIDRAIQVILELAD